MIKQERALLRKKKAAVFMLVFFFYLGLTAVDSACTEMTRHPGALTLQSKRIDENYLSVSFFGKEALVNTSWMVSEFQRIKDGTVAAISALTKMAVNQDENEDKQLRDVKLPLPTKTL